jgi:hypothetical protein
MGEVGDKAPSSIKKRALMRALQASSTCWRLGELAAFSAQAYALARSTSAASTP